MAAVGQMVQIDDIEPMTADRAPRSLDLRYFVEWHAWLWRPAVRAVLGDPGRFAGKKVLELGCGQGKMTCLFGLLGAQVTGVELPGRSLDAARSEIRKWDLDEQVSVRHYNGDPASLPAGEYHFVFSKSVLVIIPDLPTFLSALANVLVPEGTLLAVENMQRGTALRRIKTLAFQLMTTGQWKSHSYAGFHGVTPHFLEMLRDRFSIVRYQESYGLVAAIEANRAMIGRGVPERDCLHAIEVRR